MPSTARQLLLTRCAIFFEQPTATENQMEKELPSHSKTFLSVEDYLRIEETALRKSEYLNGEMTEMPGVSREHTLIVTNFVYTLESQLIDRPYEVYSSELRLKVSATGLYTYPDVIVSDAEPAFEDRGAHIFLNPILLVEVLSQSTESYDRGRKFSHYQKIPSLQEYVLVSQYEFRVEQFVRQADGKWLYTETTDANGHVVFESIACRVPMEALYHRVNFRKEEDLPA
jgi:Uma2 family endonuclease